MASYNQCTFLGNLTRAVELSYTPTQKAVAQFGIAINHKFGDKEEVTFLDCEAWGKTAEIAKEYLEKGSQVLIAGRIKQESWNDKTTGAKRSKLKVVVETLQMLGKPRQSEDHGDDSQPKRQTRTFGAKKPRDPDLDPSGDPDWSGEEIDE